MQPKKIYTVTQINRFARLSLEENFSALWIEGEISNVVTPSSGHCYFTLKDSQAQLRCALFTMHARKLKLKLENGMHVIAYGKISLYESRGDYQFIAETLEEMGDGKLQRAFELLKQKLASEGLFEQAHKKPLPTLPKQIGIITSPTGAAVRDILKLLKSRFPAIPVIIYPTLVQGELASDNIVKMIEVANTRQECDVLILARGGGSLEDLWAFNTENVARTLFKSHIPTISAVGHEIDFTIADFVADYRAPTPSAAAVCLTPDKKTWLSHLHALTLQLTRGIHSFLQQKQNTLHQLQLRLPHPQHLLRERIQQIDNLEQHLVRAMQQYLALRQHQLAACCQTLDTLSPLATLKRGYAIALTQEGHVVTHANTVKAGSPLTLKLSQGELTVVTT